MKTDVPVIVPVLDRPRSGNDASAAPTGKQPADRTVTPIRVDSVTALRWFAAAGVFSFHTKGYFNEIPSLTSLMQIGYEGVPFFFVLSGFVMAWSAKPGGTARQFYWRRFARIWPLLAVTAVVAGLLEKQWYGTPFSFTGLLYTLSFTQAWTTDHFFTVNIVTWTLSVEAFFYLAFPLLYKLLDRCASWCLGLIAVLMTAATAGTRLWPVWHHYPAATERLIFASPLALTPMFVLGICAAVAARRGWRPPVGARVSIALLAGMIALCWAWTRHPHWVSHVVPAPGMFDALFMPIFALTITTVALRDVRSGASLLRRKALVKLGEWSFAFYMCHAIVLRAFSHYGSGASPGVRHDALVVAIMLVSSVTAAAFLHECVEKPAERRLKRLWTPGRKAAAVPA
ncbi:acyltransferase family protein [Streptomyces fildesensis]|uniref:acyltransferase family protein n=1 Tax=Streptomyces fildesensis TaxID=375757 RepID=UPI0011066817|nr:acyltransferase [Streptomyces fildesensis]